MRSTCDELGPFTILQFLYLLYSFVLFMLPRFLNHIIGHSMALVKFEIQRVITLVFSDLIYQRKDILISKY